MSILGIDLTHLEDALKTDLGRAAKPHNKTVIRGVVLPDIPDGVPTQMVLVAVPVTTSGPSPVSLLEQKLQIGAAIALALFIWALPWLFANLKCRSGCLKACVSRNLHRYFFVSTVVNVVMISLVISQQPDIIANDIFFGLVGVLEFIADKSMDVLTQVTILGFALAVWMIRSKLAGILGYDHQILRADLRDVLTCFSMNRFRPIEVAILKVEDLPTGFQTKTLYMRVLLGYNEVQHTRPRDDRGSSVIIRERVLLNYDPEDDSQTLSLVVKQQELVGTAIQEFAPAVGALAGAAGGLFTPLGVANGATLGAVTGVGAANSLGTEVARVDLPAKVINDLRKKAETSKPAHTDVLSTGPVVPWSQDSGFERVSMIPQGTCYIRIHDVPEP